jgi:hypothetical protein
VETCVDDLQLLHEDNAPETEINVRPSLHVIGDPSYTMLIVQNLLENARKYGRRGDPIRVETREEQGLVSLTVANRGEPIPRGSLEHIFERFHRGSVGENIPGHGLGLNLARELARLHGGDLRLVRSDGEWTEFEATFRPCADSLPKPSCGMRRAAVVHCAIAALAGWIARADDLLDRVDEALTFSTFQDQVRLRISGTLELEYYHIDEPPFGLVNSTANNLFNPRLTLFADAQIGPYVYAFAQARIDRGFDPSDQGARGRMDEYAVRFTPWEDGRLNVQIGKFAPVVGNWMARHLAWDNPFVTAPLPYEHVTNISDVKPPQYTAAFSYTHGADTEYGYNPVIWGPSYTTGLSLSGRVGEFEYAAEVKNAALSSRPESWDATDVGFEHPTVSTRLGWRPSMAWNLGVSASRGAYFHPEAEPLLPPGRDVRRLRAAPARPGYQLRHGTLATLGRVLRGAVRSPSGGRCGHVCLLH